MNRAKNWLSAPRKLLRWKKLLLRLGFMAIMLGLIAFSLYQCTRHMTVGLNTLRTQEIVDESYVRLELYIFRDEAPVEVSGNLFLYNVQDGERVGVSDTLLTAYTAEASQDEIDARQASLDAYTARIALLEAGWGQGTLADAVNVSDAVDHDYLGFLAAANDGRVGAAFDYADRMLDGLNRYDALTGEIGGAGVTAETLRAEQMALLGGRAPTDTYTTGQSGYFYREVDGYESVFDYDAVMTMTPAEFRDMTAVSAADVSPWTAGKMVYSTTWYAAAYLPLTAAVYFEAGDGYTMICTDSTGTQIPMTVERMVYDGEGALAVFSTQSMPEGFAFDRHITVETVTDRVSGYRIPTEVLVTQTAENGAEVTGVYILTGNVVEFREVRIRAERTGYLIAYTYEDIQAEMEASGEDERPWSYLNDNDRIITSGSGVYEGQMFS